MPAIVESEIPGKTKLQFPGRFTESRGKHPAYFNAHQNPFNANAIPPFSLSRYWRSLKHRRRFSFKVSIRKLASIDRDIRQPKGTLRLHEIRDGKEIDIPEFQLQIDDIGRPNPVWISDQSSFPAIRLFGSAYIFAHCRSHILPLASAPATVSHEKHSESTLGRYSSPN